MLKPNWVAMMAALFVGVSVLAQDASDPKQPAESPSAQKKASNRPLRGDIKAVDIEAKTLTVETKRAGELVTVVVETDASTQFTLDQAQVTLVDLRAGMKVVVLPDVGVATKVSATKVKQQPKRTVGKSATPAKESSAEKSSEPEANTRVN